MITDITLPVDQEGLGIAVDAVLVRNDHIGIVQHRERKIVFTHEGIEIASVAVDGYRHHLQPLVDILAMKRRHRRHLFTAWRAPGSPEVEKNHLTLGKTVHLPLQIGQREGNCPAVVDQLLPHLGQSQPGPKADQKDDSGSK